MEDIPIGILHTTISFIDTSKQLGECRLVCKRWDPLAEKAMFGQKINIPHHEAAWAFYDHLMKDPSKGKLVKHLNIGDIYPTTVQLRRRLLQLTFSSNIEILEGESCPPEFFEDMIDIILVITLTVQH